MFFDPSSYSTNKLISLIQNEKNVHLRQQNDVNKFLFDYLIPAVEKEDANFFDEFQLEILTDRNVFCWYFYNEITLTSFTEKTSQNYDHGECSKYFRSIEYFI